jgi:hypothetical protein
MAGRNQIAFRYELRGVGYGSAESFCTSDDGEASIGKPTFRCLIRVEREPGRSLGECGPKGAEMQSGICAP